MSEREIQWSISDVKTTEGETMIVGGKGQEFGLIATVTDEADAKQIIADREARTGAPCTREPGADVLLAALRDCTCPRPANNEPDDLTIGECFDKMQCGCQNGLALSVADMARSAANIEKDPRDRKLELVEGGLLLMLDKAKEAVASMTPEELRLMNAKQRESWVVGEMMLEHPEMTRDEAAAIYARAAQ